MDAQEITFNQDPEAGATDIGVDDDSNCCCAILCAPCKLFRWYIAPITCELCHTLKCFIFHPINFALAMFLCIFDATMLGLGVGLIPLCCMGLPLLWISMEFIIAFSRMDLGLHYYMIEDGKHLNKANEHLLRLSLYFTDIPLCCCYNQRGENCMNLMFERMKFLFTNIEIYKYVLYQVIIRQVITYCTWWIMIVVAFNVGLVGIPGWYLVDNTMFVRNQVVIGYNKDCDWNAHTDGKGVVCPEDYVWIINTFGRALTVGIIALLVLPLTMRLNNWLAYLNKIGAYRFYTYYYTKDVDTIQDSQPMLANKVRINSV